MEEEPAAEADLSAQGLLERASAAAQSVYAIMALTVIRSETPGRHYQTRLEEIRTESGRYVKVSNGAEGSWESLHYEGAYFTREDSDQPWERPPFAGEDTLTASIANDAMAEIYGFNFSELSSIEFGEDAETRPGQVFLVGSVEWILRPSSPNTSELLQNAALLHGKSLPAGSLPEPWEEPDAGIGRLELWIDAESYYVRKMHLHVELARNGRAFGWYDRTSEYSDINEQPKLPGPLPEG